MSLAAFESYSMPLRSRGPRARTMVGQDASYGVDALGFVPNASGGGYDASQSVRQYGLGDTSTDIGSAGVLVQYAQGKDMTVPQLEDATTHLVGSIDPSMGAAFAALFDAANMVAGLAKPGEGECAEATPDAPYGFTDRQEFAYGGQGCNWTDFDGTCLYEDPRNRNYPAPEPGSFAEYFEGLALAWWSKTANCLGPTGQGWSPQGGMIGLAMLLGPAVAAWNASHAGEEIGYPSTVYEIETVSGYGADCTVSGAPLEAAMNALATLTGPPDPTYGIPTPAVPDCTRLTLEVNSGPLVASLPNDGTVLLIVAGDSPAFELFPPDGGAWAPGAIEGVAFEGALAFATDAATGEERSGMLLPFAPVFLEYGGTGGGEAVINWIEAGVDDPNQPWQETRVTVVDAVQPLAPGGPPQVYDVPIGSAVAFQTPDGTTPGISASSGQLSAPYDAPDGAIVLVYGGGSVTAQLDWVDGSGTARQAFVEFVGQGHVMPVPTSADGMLVVSVDTANAIEVTLPDGARWSFASADQPEPFFAFEGTGISWAWGAPIDDTSPAVILFAGGGGSARLKWVDAGGQVQIGSLELVDDVVELPSDGSTLAIASTLPNYAIAVLPPNGMAWAENAEGDYSLDVLGDGAVEVHAGMSSPTEPAVIWFGGGGDASLTFSWVDPAGTVQTSTVTISGPAGASTGGDEGDGNSTGDGGGDTGGDTGGGDTGGDTGGRTDGGTGPRSTTTFQACDEYSITLDAAAGTTADSAWTTGLKDAVAATGLQPDAVTPTNDGTGGLVLSGTWIGPASYSVPSEFVIPNADPLLVAQFAVTASQVTGNFPNCGEQAGSTGGGSTGDAGGSTSTGPSGAAVAAGAIGGGLLLWALLH